MYIVSFNPQISPGCPCQYFCDMDLLFGISSYDFSPVFNANYFQESPASHTEQLPDLLFLNSACWAIFLLFCSATLSHGNSWGLCCFQGCRSECVTPHHNPGAVPKMLSPVWYDLHWVKGLEPLVTGAATSGALEAEDNPRIFVLIMTKTPRPPYILEF